MDPVARSTKLKQEADELLQEIGLAKLCRDIGNLTPTGSYYLDVMIYPDIDLYLPPTTPRHLFQIAGQLAENFPVERLNYLNGGPGDLKNGLYIKPVIAIGNWERPWKIDIWSVDQSIIVKKSGEMRSFKERMTPEQRELIIHYKFSILTPEHRTPVFSGYFIYQAVIDHGMTAPEEISEYLKMNSIQV